MIKLAVFVKILNETQYSITPQIANLSVTQWVCENASIALSNAFDPNKLGYEDISWDNFHRPQFYRKETFPQIDIDSNQWRDKEFKELSGSIYWKDKAKEFYQQEDGSQVQYKAGHVSRN